jgi:hypothetical protein
MDAFFGNPNLARQAKKIRKLAEQRDVNTLPDPRTYAFADGLLGTAPDQMGFSAMHPAHDGIEGAGQAGFALSLISPFKNLLRGLPVGASIKSVGGALTGENLANFGQKAEREAKILKKIAAMDSSQAGLLDDVEGTFKKAQRGKVEPDAFRTMLADQGEEATLKAVRKGAHLKADGNNGNVGAPRHVNSPGKLGHMRKELDQQFSEGVSALEEADPLRNGTWYDRAKAAQAKTNEPYQLPRSLEQHAVYSAGVSPEAELGFALKHGNSRAMGFDEERAYRGPGAKTLDSAVAEERPAKLAFKVGEYHDKNDPRLKNEGLFGVNDFRAAQGFGYTQNIDGKMSPWKGGVTDTMHPFMDGETALMVDRARSKAIGGRTDWQGPHLQEVPWVYGKAQDLYSRGKNARYAGPPGVGEGQALRDANNTFEDYLYKHTGSATHEAIPGKSTGHVPGLLEADDATKQAYSNAGRWDVPAPEVNGLLDDPLQAGIGAGNRDALYGAQGFRQLPSLQGTGAYKNSAGQLETNPLTISRPLMDFPTGGNGGRLADTRAKTMSATERFRAATDAQEAGAWNLPNTSKSLTGQNSMVFDSRGHGGTATEGVMPTGPQLDAMTGLLDDTGYGVTSTSRGALLYPYNPAATPKDLQAALKKAGPGLQEAYPVGRPEKAITSSGYVPGIGKWDDAGENILPTRPFSGEATAGLLDELASAPPEVARQIGESEGVRSIIRKKTARDAALPGARQDIQNMRNFLSEADWPKAVEMIRKGMKPAAAVAALGYSINSMAGQEE